MIQYKKYINSASSRWVTFIHGAGGSSVMWYRQIRFFPEHFNVLLVDLRGHGDSQPNAAAAKQQRYTFSEIAKDVIEVLEFENIEKSHFVGISLGTIVIRQIAELYPEKVASMVMAGATLEFNLKEKFLLLLGNIFKSVVPYIFIYKIFVFVVMPGHKRSRNMFIREAKKICNKELHRLFTLTIGINSVFKLFLKTELPIPTIYLMGERDYLCLSQIKKLMQSHTHYSQLVIVPNSGHAVNIDNPEFFNRQTLSFLERINLEGRR